MIESLIICALFVYGVSTVIKGYAEFFDVDLDRVYSFMKPRNQCEMMRDRPKWQRFIMKPTFYCNVCMSSVWGSAYYVCMHGLVDPLQWILHCVITAAIIYIINQFT